MMTVSAISPSIRRMATTLVLSQPTLDVLSGYSCFSFLGVIRSTNHALVDQHLLTIGRIRKFFALLIFVCSTVAAQNKRGATKWGLSQNGTASNRDNLSERLNRTDRLEQTYGANSSSSAFASFQIARVEPFTEPPVNRSKQIARFITLALIAPAPREAHGGAEFPGFHLPRADGLRSN